MTTDPENDITKSSSNSPIGDNKTPPKIEKEVDLNAIFSEEEKDLNALFPDSEMKELLKKICRNKKDIRQMTVRFEDELEDQTN